MSMGLLRRYLNFPLVYKILIALVLGAITGFILSYLGFSHYLETIKPLGDLFINMLRMLIIPIILSTLIVGVGSISPAKLGRVGIKVFICYVLTSAAAVFIGLILANVFDLGSGLQLGTNSIGITNIKMPSMKDTLMNIVPQNLFESFASENILSVMFFALVLGIALSYLIHGDDKRIKESTSTLYRSFDGLAEALYLIVKGVMQYAPIGVFVLIAYVTADLGSDAIGSVVSIAVAEYLGILLQIIIVYGILLRIFGISLIEFLKKIKEPMITAFVTRSSSGTLPVSFRAAEDMGIEKSIYSFSLPLGSTINMDGTAIYMGLSVIFIANAIGIPLSVGQQLMVVLIAVLASIGAAGIPGSGTIMLIMVLESIGISLTPGNPAALAYALIIGIDAILDMGRSLINVTGDLVVSLVVGKKENSIDEDKWLLR